MTIEQQGEHRLSVFPMSMARKSALLGIYYHITLIRPITLDFALENYDLLGFNLCRIESCQNFPWHFVRKIRPTSVLHYLCIRCL